TAHVAMLAERFRAMRDRGDAVHRREETRFELLRGDARRALSLARDNWEVQREPADARVLLEAALSAGDRAAAAPVLSFVADNHLEHPRIASLVAELGGRRP